MMGAGLLAIFGCFTVLRALDWVLDAPP